MAWSLAWSVAWSVAWPGLEWWSGAHVILALPRCLTTQSETVGLACLCCLHVGHPFELGALASSHTRDVISITEGVSATLLFKEIIKTSIYVRTDRHSFAALSGDADCLGFLLIQLELNDIDVFFAFDEACDEPASLAVQHLHAKWQRTVRCAWLGCVLTLPRCGKRYLLFVHAHSTCTPVFVSSPMSGVATGGGSDGRGGAGNGGDVGDGGGGSGGSSVGGGGKGGKGGYFFCQTSAR